MYPNDYNSYMGYPNDPRQKNSGLHIHSIGADKSTTLDPEGTVKAKIFNMMDPVDIVEYCRIHTRIENGVYLPRREESHWTKTDDCIIFLSWVEPNNGAP